MTISSIVLVAVIVIAIALFIVFWVLPYLIKKVTTPTIVLYEAALSAHTPLKNAAEGFRRAFKQWMQNASDKVQGTHVVARIFYLVLAAGIIACDYSLIASTLPVVLRAKIHVPTLPLDLASVLGFSLAMVIDLALFVEFSGHLSHAGEYLYSPSLAKAWRATILALVCLSFATLVVLSAYVAALRTVFLHRESIGGQDIVIAVVLAVAITIPATLVSIAFFKAAYALAALGNVIVACVCGCGFVLFRLPAGACGFTIRSIQKLNPRATRPASPLGQKVIEEEIAAIAGGTQRIGLLLNPPATPPKEQKVKTEKNVIFQDVGLENADLMEKAATIAAPVTLATATTDPQNQPHKPLGIHGIADVSPTDRQHEQASRAGLQGSKRLQRLEGAFGWNVRQVYAKVSGPAPLLFTMSSLDDAIQMPPAFAQLAKDIPAMTHVVIAAPSPLLLASQTMDSLHQMAETLHKDGGLDAVILYQPNSPLAEAKGELMQKKALQGLLGALALTRRADMLGNLKRFASVWTAAFATAPVPVGRALEPHQKGGYETIRRFFNRNWGQHGYPNITEIVNQVDQLFERVVEERNTHALAVPADASKPLCFVTLLPFRADDDNFAEAVERLQARLKQRYPLPIGMFLPSPGISDVDREEGYYASVFCLFPVVSVGLLGAPTEI